jgi:hypothetical protein
MTARKPTSTFLFALALASALALSGCYLFSNNDDKKPPAAQTNVPSVSQAQEDFRKTSARFESANRAAQDAKTEADQAKKDADALEALARKHEVDFNDPTSRTAKARVIQKQKEDEYTQAAATAETARQEVEKAKANLEAATNVPKSTPAAPSVSPPVNPERETDDLTVWLLPGILGLIGLVILGALFWWTWATIQDGNEKLAKLLSAFATKQESSQAYQSTSKHLNELAGKVAVLQSSIFNLSQMVQAQAQAKAQQKEWLPEKRTPEPYPPYGTQPADPDPYAPSDGYSGEAIDFPITATNFLTRFGGQQQVVKPDPLKGILVKDPDGRGAFVLVRDGSVPGGQLCIIPRTTRFQAAEDFYNHYEKFYDCVRLTPGEVWVNTPAVVTSVDGGWKLFEKGELEVKA